MPINEGDAHTTRGIIGSADSRTTKGLILKELIAEFLVTSDAAINVSNLRSSLPKDSTLFIENLTAVNINIYADVEWSGDTFEQLLLSGIVKILQARLDDTQILNAKFYRIKKI